MRNLLSTGACLVLVGAGLGVTAAPASACPYGTVPSSFEGVCVSGPAGAQMAPPIVSSSTGAVIGGGGNQLPTVNGIPCTPQKIGTCIGLIQSQG